MEAPGGADVPRGLRVPRDENGPRDATLAPGAEVARRALVIACGALAREIAAVTQDLPGIDVRYLPAKLHNRPEQIPAAVRAQIATARADGYGRLFIGYADCGTGGLLDRVAREEGVERLPGAHCYEFYAGSGAFAALHDEEPGTFYLTDFLVRAFDGLVWRGLGLDRHPELRDAYFGNYRRVVYLAQAPTDELVARARAAADRLGLAFELRETGFGGLAEGLRGFASAVRPGTDDGESTNAGAGARPSDPEASARRVVVRESTNPDAGASAGDREGLSGGVVVRESTNRLRRPSAARRTPWIGAFR